MLRPRTAAPAITIEVEAQSSPAIEARIAEIRRERSEEDVEPDPAADGAPALLAFLERTGVDPCWLLTGEGDKYRTRQHPRVHLF